MEASQAQQQPDLTEEAALAALVVILMSGAPAPEMASFAVPLLAPLGIPAAAVTASVGLLWPHLEHDVVTATEKPFSAVGHTLRTQPAREAAYLLNAAKRIASNPTQLRQAITTERRYVGQHLAAERGRRDAARSVDQVAARFGPELGWYSVRDERSTAGCRAAHGTNFNVATPPVVEGRPAYPGSVHLHCRCKAGAPHLVAVREPAQVLVGA